MLIEKALDIHLFVSVGMYTVQDIFPSKVSVD
jgi:hypothetical protein